MEQISDLRKLTCFKWTMSCSRSYVTSTCYEFVFRKNHIYILHLWKVVICTLLLRHNGCGSISNHQPHDCLLNHFSRRRSKKTSKLRVTGLCAGNSPVTGEFPAQMASNAENASIWWRHHDYNDYGSSHRKDSIIGKNCTYWWNVCTRRWLVTLDPFNKGLMSS